MLSARPAPGLRVQSSAADPVQARQIQTAPVISGTTAESDDEAELEFSEEFVQAGETEELILNFMIGK